MRTLAKACILFFISVCIILLLPIVTAGDEPLAWYNATNVTYGNISCGTGGLYPGKDIWWCWVNYSERNMDHSFMTFEAMDAYYNPGDGLIVGGGETYTLSAFNVREENVPTSEPSIISGIFAYIQALFT